MPKKEWQRGTCAKCGKSGYLYEGTDLFWTHDTMPYPVHVFVLVTVETSFTPDENAVADERHDERFTPQQDPDEDAWDYGMPKEVQTGW